MFFASDNSGPVPAQVLAALAEANQGYAMGYGADALMDEVRQRIRDLFEAPEAVVHLVTSGTAANVLALSSICQPFQTIFCSSVAHIHEDECNAPEFYTGGAKLTLVPGDDIITPEALIATIEGEGNRGVHGPARGPVSLTNVTEMGNLYSVGQIAALAKIAKGYGLPVHLDGARFANAVVALGCTPAEMTWKAGVDVVSFGGTKNGLMGVEAVIFFNPDHAASFEHRRKRGGHLLSKHRYLSAQMAAYLRDDLWRDLAARANANMARVAGALRTNNQVRFLNEPRANMLFVEWPRAWHQRALGGGAMYHLWGGTLEGEADAPLTCRLVADWSMTDQAIDQFTQLVLP
ncbi:threonine aldolase family protein [Pseudoprimorskyibacter insulae]|uniref:Low specificity L-threonine aldolase n=1 Tax=Pseudoprimorskyibacter insulae TaxID=1695997 RepID=A0A2R8AV26_9RHOB|nr:beta-eliminating lyase-related protein [Pseudoprimorskyibacter insulae]SPF79729.1 Low specificity L-threonine aldolase [Pseudoprimorskyibacter insulae]